MLSQIQCPKCSADLLPPSPGELFQVECRACQSKVEVMAFPALTRTQSEGRAPEAVVLEGEAACFYHPKKKAHVPCDLCGRFLCRLCQLELNGQNLCPTCLQSARSQGNLQELEPSRFVYDAAALSLAVLPLLFGLIAIVTAPIAIFFAIRSFSAPGSLVSRGKARAICALILALLEFGGCLWLLIFLFTRR